MSQSQDTPPTTPDVSGLACPDPLEKIFQQVEEQNERRARQEAVEDTVSDRIQRMDSSDNLKKSRRRGSISISRFGQLSSSDAVSDGSSGPMTPALSDIAAKSPFFQAQLKANGSQTSFASGGSAADDAEAHHEDDHHVTHMHTIAPKQSISRAVGGFFPRRLSRARSTVLPSNDVVIGVSVAAATVELPENAEVAATVVHAPGALHHQASKASLTGSLNSRNTWAERAKKFTKKFRRKSKNPLADADANAAPPS